MLKSPTKIEYEFSLLNVCSDGVISSMKHEIFWLLLLSLGGLSIYFLMCLCVCVCVCVCVFARKCDCVFLYTYMRVGAYLNNQKFNFTGFVNVFENKTRCCDNNTEQISVIDCGENADWLLENK